MIYFILFIVVIFSGFSVFLFKDVKGKKIKLLLSFSGAYLLSVSLLHLIPDIYKSSDSNWIGVYILLGFFIQILLEYFSKGIEHGHIHLHRTEHAHHFPFAVVASLCVHSFLEGMPLAKVVRENDFTNNLLIGILLHNIPISIILMALLIQETQSRNKAVFWLVVFALMLPLGAAVNYFLEVEIGAEIENYNSIILAVVVGIFLHISTTILFEASENHRFNFYKFMSILIGAGLTLINL